MKCPRCGYDWEPKVPSPKECPRCKARLDYAPRHVGAPRIGMKKKEVKKEMTSRLPWVAAALIIVAAVGAYAIFGVQQVTQPTLAQGLGISGTGTVKAVRPPLPPTVTVWAAAPVYSGIENIYIMKSRILPNPVTYDIATNLSGHENILAVFTATAQVGYIPADTAFDVVIAVKGHDDNLAYIVEENVMVEFGTTAVVGTLTRDGAAITSIALENSANADEYPFKTTTTFIRLNACSVNWDNMKLTAGSEFDWSAKLWCWG